MHGAQRMNAAIEILERPDAEMDAEMDAILETLSVRVETPPSPDVIFIRQLRLNAHIGAYAEERKTAQTLEFDLEIGRFGLRACTSDRLSDTIDYAEVVGAIDSLLATSRVHLLEALAESVAELLFDRFGAHSVAVDVAKTDIVPGARLVGVSIRRARRGHDIPLGAASGALHSLPAAKARPT